MHAAPASFFRSKALLRFALVVLTCSVSSASRPAVATPVDVIAAFAGNGFLTHERFCAAIFQSGIAKEIGP